MKRICQIQKKLHRVAVSSFISNRKILWRKGMKEKSKKKRIIGVIELIFLIAILIIAWQIYCKHNFNDFVKRQLEGRRG